MQSSNSGLIHNTFKHGARASSSASGSADVLLALGIPITSLPLSRIPSIASSLDNPFLFLFAPLCHPALALVAPIRKQLGHPTIFNILGPLLNPARPDYMIVGVHSRYLGLPFAEALKRLKIKKAWVVNGDEGLDEISPEGTTHVRRTRRITVHLVDMYTNHRFCSADQVWALENGEIEERIISPETFGLPRRPLSSVAGGKPAENAQYILDLLQGKLNPETSPVENFVVMNAAALLVVAGKAKDEKEGVRLARLSITEGKGFKALNDYKTAAQRAIKEEEAESGDA